MQNTNTAATEISPAIKKKNTLPVIGFILMILGPIIMALASLFISSFGYVSKEIANIISWTAIVLPGIGAVISIVSLFLWKKTGKLGHILSITTVVMCNPIFYIFYYVICALSVNVLANLPMM